MLQLLEQLGAQPCSQRLVLTGTHWQSGLRLTPASNCEASLRVPGFCRRRSNGECNPGTTIVLTDGTQNKFQDQRHESGEAS